MCGRPLGLRLHKDGLLYVVDGYQGLFSINLQSGQKTQIPLRRASGQEYKNAIYNDLVFDHNQNVIYITVSSTRWLLERIPWSIIEHENSSFLIAMNLKTKTASTLLEGLYFGNGLEITKTDLLLSELGKRRILKISLEDIKSALNTRSQIQKENVAVLTEDLVGEPDNIRIHGDDLWVGIFQARVDGKTLSDHLAAWPFARKALGRLCYLLSVVTDYVYTNLWQNPALESLRFKLYSGHLLYDFVPKTGAILRLDVNNGKVKQILGSNKFNSVSEAIIDSRGDLYFGSFRNQFLGKIKKGDY